MDDLQVLELARRDVKNLAAYAEKVIVETGNDAERDRYGNIKGRAYGLLAVICDQMEHLALLEHRRSMSDYVEYMGRDSPNG